MKATINTFLTSIYKKSKFWMCGFAFFVFLTNVSFAEDVVKKTDVIRGMNVEESVYYLGDKEIAREKTSTEGMIDHTGKVPDGKIKFVDNYKDTYGEEYYRNGKKDGRSRTYYKNGKLMKESYYKEGRLIKSKEYYETGIVRFEVDYQNARYDATKGTQNPEVGIGKLYYPSGVLKYEWNITRGQMTGYKRSYNADGSIRMEVQVDDQGNIIK